MADMVANMVLGFVVGMATAILLAHYSGAWCR